MLLLAPRVLTGDLLRPWGRSFSCRKDGRRVAVVTLVAAQHDSSSGPVPRSKPGERGNAVSPETGSTIDLDPVLLGFLKLGSLKSALSRLLHDLRAEAEMGELNGATPRDPSPSRYGIGPLDCSRGLSCRSVRERPWLSYRAAPPSRP